MSVQPLQLHLPLERVREPTLEVYLPGVNGEAVAAIRAAAMGSGESFLYLFGAPETGKTHLLQAACLMAMQGGRQARYIPLGQAGLRPDILDGLELLELVALDDLQQCAGVSDWEIALFTLINRLREQSRTLLVAADQPPDALPLDLADLRSRLHWGPRYRLFPLSDADSERLLRESARTRGLVLEPATIRYILTRYPRHPSALMDLLAGIDSLSLREQRPPTIPLVRRVMEGHNAGPGMDQGQG